MMKLQWFGLLGFFSSPSLDYKVTLFSSVTTQLLDISEQTDKLLLTEELRHQSPGHLLL